MKRQRIEIMAQILAFCIRARRKTRIMYGNNLSHAQLKTYLTLLTSRDLLANNSDGYLTTQKGHLFLDAFAQLNDMLEDRARRPFLEIISESEKEVDIAHIGWKAKLEDADAQTTAKKAAIVIFISLAHEAEKKTSEELETEIRKALEKDLARIPWVAVERVIVLKE